MKNFLVLLGRIIATLAIIFLFLFALGEGISELLMKGMKIKVEGLVLFLLLLLAAGSTIIAWVRGKIGAHLFLISGLCLAVFSFIIAARNRWLMALIMGGPFLLSAILIYFAIRKKRSREIMKTDSEYEQQETLPID